MSSYTSAIVGAVLFILTSLGVINSMFMSIYERIYEFGVAKAIGTTPRQIIALVLFEAFFSRLNGLRYWGSAGLPCLVLF
jgi:ABC-type antimicrobial peptide transport system permease subunit